MKSRTPKRLRTLETFEYRRLLGIIRQVRNRWRLKILLRGIGLVALTALATVVLGSWGLDAFRYRPWVVSGLSIGTYALLLGAFYRFIVRPLWRQLSDTQVALYIEEHAPKASGALLSAVEFGVPDERSARPEISARFVEKVVQEALAHGARMGYGKNVDRRDLRRVSGFLGAASMAVVVTVLVNPAFVRHGAPLLFRPWGLASSATPYDIAVRPGSGEVARGGDQLISASLSGFDSDRVEISFKLGAGEWEREPMTAGEDAYTFMFLDLSEPTEYFVEASGVRSALYRLDVVDLPYVRQIDLELEFPAYSGLPPQRIDDGGDVAALAGTRVRLHIVPTVEVPGGRLLIETPSGEGESDPAVREIPLQEAEGAFGAEFTVAADGYYRIELESWDGGYVKASSEYLIEVLSDQPPVLAFESPGRDLTASPIEEIFAEVSADDDFGLGRVELVWSLNGSEERRLSLFEAPDEAQQHMTASHTFYLEEEELEPGDFISYYARAWDNRDPGGAQMTTTDIYFVQVRPFQRDYRQADAGGGGGGGGGGGNLAQKQKMIVAATFKIARDREHLASEQVREDLALLERTQEQLRQRTMELSARFSGATDGALAEGFKYLQEAARVMEEARTELGELDPQGALRPEQVALHLLQAFEALTRDMIVSFEQGQGGGGGAADMERLAEMFDFEGDALDNQYETVQRQRQQQTDNEVDAALQRLTELARRQQQEIERQRAQAARAPNQGTGGGNQRDVAQQAEELARKLERLARQSSRRELQEAANRLQQAADAMRRSAASGGERRLTESAKALGELNNARRLLDKNRKGRLQRDFRDLQSRVADMRAAQQRIESEVDRPGAGGQGDRERLERLMGRKDELAEQIDEVESQIDRMARGSRGTQMKASRGLQEAAEWIRDSKLSDKVRYSKGVVQERNSGYARRFEEGISDDLERLDSMVASAAEGMQVSEQDQLASALEDTRQLVERLESFAQRLQQAQDARQLGREFQQRIRDAEKLRDRLAERGVQVADLELVIGAMRDFEAQFEGSLRGLDDLRREVIDGLKLFEFWLHRITDAASGRRPQLAGSDEVPESYREMVEEYYRALAAEPGRPR